MVLLAIIAYGVIGAFYGLHLDNVDPANWRKHDLPAILWPLDIVCRLAGAVTQKLLPPPGDDVP